MSIKSDHQRFRNIVKGQVKDNLKKYITRDDLIGKSENDFIKIPIHRIDIPHFKFGSGEEEGVGMGGEGQGDGQGQPGNGQEAGDQSGEHQLMDFSVEELATMLGDELNLPRIEPKGNKANTVIEGYKYSSRANQGPEGLKHFKSTYKKSLKRLLSSGQYDPENPIVIPQKADKIYKSYKPILKPQAQAVIFYLMDVSGSMGDEQKTIVKIETFWINAWLKKHYPKLETRFIIHDAKAQEVDEKTFFNTQESGGTVISSAYDLTKQIIKSEYALDEWNIYMLHFSDGDNWSGDDTQKCIKMLNDEILKVVNLFGYGQVDSRHGSGGFINDLRKGLGSHEKVVLSSIQGREHILKSIKEFLGSGK
jgi:uncharacterized sporulation protein YeaH/YhbH (DUF444 family)